MQLDKFAHIYIQQMVHMKVQHVGQILIALFLASKSVPMLHKVGGTTSNQLRLLWSFRSQHLVVKSYQLSFLMAR